MSFQSKLFRHFFPEVIASRTYRGFNSSSGVVLMYHEVLPDEFTLPAWTVVRESDFRWQIEYISHHFDLVSIDEALDRVSGEKKNKKPFAVITFDDGYSGNLSTVLPLMKSQGFPFIVYPATKKIINNDLYWFDKIISVLNYAKEIEIMIDSTNGGEKYLIPKKGDSKRWKNLQKLLGKMKTLENEKREEISENIFIEYCNSVSPLKMLSEVEMFNLSKSDCVIIGSHTHDHELLDQLSSTEIEETLNVSLHHIKRITGNDAKHFSYPNGNYNKFIAELIRLNRFESAVTTSPGLFNDFDCRMEIPRIGVGRFDTEYAFKARIARWC